MFEVESGSLNFTGFSSYCSNSAFTCDFFHTLLLIINTLIVIFGVIGNGTVLFLSKNYKALRTDKISLVLLESLAAADILCALTLYFPTLITLIANKWVFGRLLCGVFGYSFALPFCAEIMLIMTLTFHRLYVLKRPLRAGGLRARTGHIIVTSIWCLSGLVLVSRVVKYDVMFVPAIFTCDTKDSKYSDDQGSVAELGILCVPMIAIVLGNIWMLVIVAKSQGKVGHRSMPGRQAVVTTSMIGGCFFISLGVTLIAQMLDIGYKGKEWRPGWTGTLQIYSISLNFVINPFIYYLRNPGFRNTVQRILIRTHFNSRFSSLMSRGGSGVIRNNDSGAGRRESERNEAWV